jgi:hypothetical protein
MNIDILRVDKTKLEKHLKTAALKLARAADLTDDKVSLKGTPVATGIGDLQIRLQRSNGTREAINQRTVTEQVLKLWYRDETKESMYFGYSEEWSADRTRYCLSSAALRFFYSSGLDRKTANPVQLLRFEWAEAGLTDEGRTYSYPAKGAGTPHWHYDGLEADEEMRELILLRELLEKDPRDQPREFGAATLESGLPSMRCLAGWFGGIHFPVFAQWQREPLQGIDFEILKTNPHAISPTNIDELENMMTSAVYYIRHQLENCSR